MLVTHELKVVAASANPLFARNPHNRLEVDKTIAVCQVVMVIKLATNITLCLSAGIATSVVDAV